MITFTFFEVLALGLLSAISFSTTALFALTAVQEYRYHKAKKTMLNNMVFALGPQQETATAPVKAASPSGNYQ